MRGTTPSILFYRLISWLLFLPALIYTIVIAAKYRNLRYLQQRLSRRYPTLSKSILLHCASVGEINTCLPLLRLIVQHSQLPVVVTTNTITGAQVLARHPIDGVIHAYFPLDYKVFASTLLEHFKPQFILIMETELWPTFLVTAQSRKIRTFMINGRITAKTLHTPAWLQRAYHDALSGIEKILARSERDKQSFLQLGIKENQCEAIGDLKYSHSVNSAASEPRPIEPEYLLCISTHDDEEIQIAQAWHQNVSLPYRLVIAPRHPQRTKTICQQFDKAGITYFLHSTRSGYCDGVYIIDSIGELKPFIQHAEIVFVGGTLVRKGGHNPLEAAQQKKCILIGPHHDHFLDMVEELKQARGLFVVSDSGQLIQKIHELSNQPELRRQTGERGFQTASQRANMHHRYYKILASACGLPSQNE